MRFLVAYDVGFSPKGLRKRKTDGKLRLIVTPLPLRSPSTRFSRPRVIVARRLSRQRPLPKVCPSLPATPASQSARPAHHSLWQPVPTPCPQRRQMSRKE